MAHYKLWYQGSSNPTLPTCAGKPTFTCPQARTVAAEYGYGYYNLSNVLVPTTGYETESYETWLREELRTKNVGDYLWLVLAPPMHVVRGVYAHNATNLIEQSSLATMDGITLSLVTGEFAEANADGNCEMRNEQVHGALAFTAAEPQVLFKPVEVVNDHKTWLGVGLRIDALPSDGALAEIIGKISCGCHLTSYDTQNFM